MTLSSCTATHVGKVREKNEDASLCLPDRGLFAIADGMGGHPAGDTASHAAIIALRNGITASAFDLGRTFKAAHTRVLRLASENREHVGMGTTLTACAIVGNMLYVAHVGDSACFLVRNTVRKLTTDQVSWSGGLLNCIGVDEKSFKGAEHLDVRLAPGDIVILASDGLTRYLDDRHRPIPAVAMAAPFPLIASALVEYAIGKGGKDNVTVVAVRVE